MTEEESTQRHTGELTTPAAHHRASLESATPKRKKPTRPPRRWEDRVIRFLAGLFCLGASGFCLLYLRNLVWTIVFLIGAIDPGDFLKFLVSRLFGLEKNPNLNDDE